MNILIPIIFVLILVLYDYLHDKATWKLASTWVKYVVALACGLSYSLITSVAVLHWIVIGGVVVLGYIFWGIISKWAIALYNKVTNKPPTTP